MLNDQDYEIAAKLFNETQMQDFYTTGVKYFNRRATHLTAAIAKDDVEITQEDFAKQIELGIENGLMKVFNVCSFFVVKKLQTDRFSFMYEHHVFYQREDGTLWFLEPMKNGYTVFGNGKEITFDEAYDRLIDLSVNELEHFSKIELRALSLMSPHEFKSLYDFIAESVQVVDFAYVEISKDFMEAASFLRDLKPGQRILPNTPADNYISSIKTSTFDHVKFAAITFLFFGTQYKLYPINEMAYYCLEYDNQRVVYTEFQMKFFLQNLFRDKRGMASINDSHYTSLIPQKVEHEFIQTVQPILLGLEAPHEFNRCFLTPYGKFLSYSQIIDAGMDPVIAKYCHFDVADGCASIYISKVEPLTAVFENHILKTQIVYDIDKLDAEFERDFVDFTLFLNEKTNDTIKELDSKQSVDFINWMQSASDPISKHFSKAWKSYLKDDPTRALRIQKQIDKAKAQIK